MEVYNNVQYIITYSSSSVLLLQGLLQLDIIMVIIYSNKITSQLIQ